MLTTHPPSSAEVKELSYTSTHPMGPPGPVTEFRYLYFESRTREDLWNLHCFNVLLKVAVSTVPMFCLLFVVKFLMIDNGPKFRCCTRVSFIFLL
jgi:hypothetical protein